MAKVNKGFWIDRDVWMDKNLNKNDMALYQEIVSLHNKRGCSAKYTHFSEKIQVSIPTVKRSIAKLKRLGYIIQTNYDGRKITFEPTDRSDMSHQVDQSDTTDSSKRSIREIKVSHQVDQSDLSTPIAKPVQDKQKSEPTNTVTNTSTSSNDDIVSNDTTTEKIPATKKRKRTPKLDDQGNVIDTEYRTNQYMDMLSKWNELTGQQQVFNKKKFGYFCNRINNEGHTFEDYYSAMMNYARDTYWAPKQAWRFGKMFDDDTFIGEYVNKFPRKQLSESDKSIARVKAMRDKQKAEASNG